MGKFKLKIVGLKKNVQSRVMITGIHSVPIYIESVDDYKEKLKVLLKNIKFGKIIINFTTMIILNQ